MIQGTRGGRRGPRRFSRIRELDLLGPCIYAVRTQDGLIKIGWSAEVGSRISRIGGVESLLGLRLASTLDDEREIHARLDGHAVRGREWYPDTEAVRNVVQELSAETRSFVQTGSR